MSGKIKNTGLCCIEGCNDANQLRGYCRYHYHHFRNKGELAKIQFGDKRNHPFYVIWWQRKQDNLLCGRWLDFLKFIEDISPKPDGNYFLVRLRNEPFGPDNFKWREHLKRKPGEPRKEWWARKWATRQAANPGMESSRHLQRRFGITKEQYLELLKKQNSVCAICGNGETATNAKTGTSKQLAVDHCHKTGKIRQLLCWRCNVVLGKVCDDVELIDKLKAYLIKHKDC